MSNRRRARVMPSVVFFIVSNFSIFILTTLKRGRLLS